MADERKPYEENLERNFDELFRFIDFTPDARGKCKNVSGRIASFTLTAGVNTVRHGFGRKPNAILNAGQSGAATIQISNTPTGETVTITSDAAVTLKVLLI